ncbi:hypothetical protein FQN54_005278 [Arachnomyces sp. PD_36]|nr:hypothetical protein FQN54_005278 [Arachnomyces sp. PD_36]
MAVTKIQILSDLHLEVPSAYDAFPVEPKAPYLALLGDIGNTKDDGLFDFIKEQLSKFKIVFFLFGNHEPYHSDWTTATARVQSFAQQILQEKEKDTTNTSLGEFIFLNQTRHDLSDTITILGCPLYSNIPPERSMDLTCGLNDFYQISNWTTEAHTASHLSDLRWLNEQVSKISTTEPSRSIVILTHHSPHQGVKAADPAHAGSKLTSGFSTDLSGEECFRNSAVKVWVFGHTHFNCDFVDEGVGARFFTNQRGYYFAQAGGFDVGKCVEV